jgi:hypothetical protein
MKGCKSACKTLLCTVHKRDQPHFSAGHGGNAQGRAQGTACTHVFGHVGNEFPDKEAD